MEKKEKEFRIEEKIAKKPSKSPTKVILGDHICRDYKEIEQKDEDREYKILKNFDFD